MSRIQPALSDGRCFTNYLAACQYDQIMQAKFGSPNDATYRKFLQDNALMAQDESRKLDVWSCGFPFMDAPKPTVVPAPGRTPAPYRSKAPKKTKKPVKIQAVKPL